MTGNVVFPLSVAFGDGSVDVTPMHARPAPSYSVDTFSEFSFFAVSRMPSTSAMVSNSSSTVALDTYERKMTAQEQDEELFRDLFAANTDWDAAGTLDHSRLGHSMKKAPRQHASPKPPLVWGSGASGSQYLSSPFASSPSHTTSQTHAPLAPVPRLNFAELINARPSDGSSTESRALGGWGHGLEQVAEENADDERPESNAEPAMPYARTVKSSKATRSTGMSNNNNNSKLQQETLSFLEKLDLKALLHTPRPDVLDFTNTTSTVSSATISLSGSNAAAARSASFSTEVAGKSSDDARVECDRDAALPLRASKTTPGKPMGKRESGDVSARLSHMASTYGTTASETRKTRRGTIERLANPILGFTSTLQALSPEQRRKRELALSEDGWNACVHSPMGGKQSKRDVSAQRAVTGLNHSTRVYDAAATKPSQRLRKPAGERATVRSTIANNQRDDKRERATPLVKRKSVLDTTSLSARKAALRKKLEAQQQANQESDESAASRLKSASVGATFLTQHEDDEAKLSSRAQQLQLARPTLQPPVVSRPLDSSVESRQPRRPVSMRAAKPSAPAQPSQDAKRGHRYGGGCEHDKAGASAAPRGGGGGRQSVQKPLRIPGSRQQSQQLVAPPATAPSKPSNSDGGTFSGRRSFARANAAKAVRTPSVGSIASTPASVLKRKTSGPRGTAAAMLLFGSTVQPTASTTSDSTTPVHASGISSRRSGNASGRQSRKAQGPSTAAAPRPSYTPQKQASSNALGLATPKEKPVATERGKRSSRDAIITDRTAKSSGSLPSIPAPKGRQGAVAPDGADVARRGNNFFRRVRVT